MRKEILPLTSLRGVAAMAVILLHFSATLQKLTSQSFPSLAPRGYLAVDIFFILSGFIMAYTYLETFRTQDLSTSYRTFLLKRAARILPLNAAVTLFFIATALGLSALFGFNPFPNVKPENAGQDLLTNLLLLPGIGIGTSINWPAWSISVEFVAYFFFPFFLLLIFNRRRWVFVVTCLTAIAALIGICLENNEFSPAGIHNHPPPWRDLTRCFSQFLLGLAVYRIYASGRFTDFFRRDSVVLILSAAILGIIGLRLGDIFAMLLFPPLLLCLTLNTGRIARIMATRFLYFLGLISFSLYLVHDNFRDVAVLLIQHIHPEPLDRLTAMALVLFFSGLMILPSWLAYLWVEKPGRHWFQMLLGVLPSRSSRIVPES